MITLSTRCCIVGGGPAGMMLGLLLARAGIAVTVLEKHGDFLRDFRGDTIHPSTLELMHELGLLDEFLAQPHQEARTVRGTFGDLSITFADFGHLPTRCKFIAMMPQWDFLNFLARHGRRYRGFRLLMNAEATGPIVEDGRVVGVDVRMPDGPLAIRCPLVVGCDGRHSTMRAAAGLKVDELGAPMDVLWFRLRRPDHDPDETMGLFMPGRIIVMINRGDYWQCAFVIAKGSIEAVHRRGLDAFRSDIAQAVPWLAERTGEIDDWDKVKLLTVAVDRLRYWHRPGLLCIGDAAHAMSPIGGVGINLAVQDAVAAANILAGPLGRDAVGDDELAAVQARREFPTRVTQRLQVLLQDRVIRGVLGDTGRLEPPLLLKLMAHWPWLRRIPARLIGLGIRPEHVRTPERAPA